MSFHDSDLPDPRAQALARLAALQRLRDQARQDRREAMLQSIEKLIEQERQVLREWDRDAEPQV